MCGEERRRKGGEREEGVLEIEAVLGVTANPGKSRVDDEPFVALEFGFKALVF